jgi:hypothetical protein
MRQRCSNPRNGQFHNYGARGIAVCERWSSFENFLSDMGPRPSAAHSLERRDNDRNYEPGNCCWATALEQGNNTRKRRLLAYDGLNQSIAEWARQTGIGRRTLMARLRLGWSVERTLTEPVLTIAASAGESRLSTARWIRLRVKIFGRDNYTCRICKTKRLPKQGLVCHHIVPVRCGGADEEGNLVTLCRPCHAAQEFLYGKPGYFW